MGRNDEVAVLEDQRLGPDKPRIGDPADERHGDIEAAEAGPQDRDDGNHQHEEGEGDDDIDDAHENGIDKTAERLGPRRHAVHAHCRHRPRLSLPRADARDSRRARPRPVELLHCHGPGRLGVLCPARQGAAPRPQGRRFRHRRAQPRLQPRPRDVSPPPAQCPNRALRLRDVGCGARAPQRRLDQLSRPRRAAADTRMGRHGLRGSGLRHDGLVDHRLPRPCHRAPRLRFQPFGDGLGEMLGARE